MKEFSIFRLRNGLQVVFAPERNSEVMHAALTIGAGTRDELPHEQGMAHFLEHVLFKGTRKRKTLDIISRLDSVGGELNAYTTKEETCVYGSFDKQFLDRGLELIGDIVFNSIFPSKEITKEKTVIIDEIQSYLDSPSELIFDEFEEHLFYGHPLGHNILGTEESLKSFSRKHVLDFIRRNYRPSMMTLSISGKTSEKEIRRLAEKYFGKQTENDVQHGRVKPEAGKKFKVKKNYSTFQDHFLLGGEAYPREHVLRPAMILVNNILGGNAMNSRLNLTLREKHGFAYNVESSYAPFTDCGLYTIYFGTDHRNVSKCETLVMKELKKIKNEKLTTSQLEQAKVQLKGQISLAEENRLNRTLALGKSLLLYGKIHTMKEVYRKIDAIKASDLLHVSNEIFDESKMSRLIYHSK